MKEALKPELKLTNMNTEVHQAPMRPQLLRSWAEMLLLQQICCCILLSIFVESSWLSATLRTVGPSPVDQLATGANSYEIQFKTTSVTPFASTRVLYSKLNDLLILVLCSYRNYHNCALNVLSR